VIFFQQGNRERWRGRGGDGRRGDGGEWGGRDRDGR